MTHTRSLSEVQDGKSASNHRSKKFMNVTVNFLDNSSHVFQLQAKNLGQVLFDKVCKFINLLEVDYFGLEYGDDNNTKYWLDALKPLCNQIATSFPTMHFCVKFYTPDPVQLEDEYTRYLFGLQMRKDLANGHLQCNDNIAAIMLSYIVQADLGDYNPEKCADGSYLSAYKFIPIQDEELEKKIKENHRKLIGQTPAEADLNLLETARRCELYGIKLTAAKDHEGVPLNLAVAHLGVLVFQNFTKISTFSWVKIRKLSFKRKKFLIKLHPEGYGYYKDTVEYFFDDRNDCKNFWKKCIENHTFFRCTDSKQGMRQKPKIFSRGSSFRYSGRTQKQVSEFVRENCFKRQPFQRSTSLRTPSSPSRSISITTPPQPLLPVTSVSCGSISDISKEAIPSQQRPTSTSEPTTPHVAPDLQTSNGPKAPNSGLVSPDGFQSPDFLGQDTDDNISHDSYHVLEKEVHATNIESLLLTNNSNNDNEVPDNDQNGKCIDSKDTEEEEEYKRKSKRHRVRVFSNHINIGQTSPTLYVRANRHLLYNGPEKSCKAYPRTVDFVFVNQLPAIGSFSYRDDSVEIKSPVKLKLDMLQQKCLLDVVSDVVDVRPTPLGVDLLNDVRHADNMHKKKGSAFHKESALKFIADNLVASCNSVTNDSNIATKSNPIDSNLAISSHPIDKNLAIKNSPCHRDFQCPSTSQDTDDGNHQDHIPKFDRKRYEDIYSSRAYQNFCQMVYLDMASNGDYVNRSSPYAYNNYTFCQIGRPPELLLQESALSDPSADSQFNPIQDQP